MKRTLISTLFILALASIQAKPKSSIGGRIVGGTSTTIAKYPYQVSVQYDGSHYCGGSLITNKYAITAAHCTDGKTASLFTIRAGSSYHNVGGQVVSVSQVFQHPDYVNPDYDVSILGLSQEVTTAAAGTIALVEANTAVPVNAVGVVTGWGYTQEGGNLATQLQELEVPILSDEVCSAAYVDEITSRMFCAGYLEGGRDACQADSGGPLVYNNKLIGLVSWGNGCARQNYPGVYADVSVLRPFIDSVIG